MNSKLDRYQELDALRGIAALMVVLFHFTKDRPQAELGFELGTTGVDLFFIISGFVIFMSINKVKTSKDFIINRVSRLYPTYWACVTFTSLLVIMLSVFYGHKELTVMQYLANMTMFQYFLKIKDIDGPYWTLTIEMVFYIAILFLFHFKLIKYLKPAGLILSIIFAICAAFFYTNIVHKIFIYIPLVQFLPLFYAGIIFYKIYTEQSRLLENYCILLVCLVGQILMFHHAGWSKLFINQSQYAVMLTLYFLIFTLFVNGKLKFIVSRASLFLGQISYALYLIHQKISIDFIIPLLVDKYHVNFWVASLLVSLPIVIVLATIITFYIEVPLSRKMKEKLRTTPGLQFSSRPAA